MLCVIKLHMFPGEEHILVTMNIVVVVLNRSNELTTIERIPLRSDFFATQLISGQTAYIWFQRQGFL